MPDFVDKLLKNDMLDVNRPDKQGNTALIRASSQGHKRIVVQLLKHGKVDVNHQNIHGNTALMTCNP
jgi:ankyrin repeat protein